MDSLYSPSLEAVGPQLAFFPTTSHALEQTIDMPNEPRKYMAEDWEAQKSEITRLYDDNTLESVRTFMRERYGLDATPKQYKDRIKKWGLDKKVKTAEMEAIIRKQRERALTSGKASAFRVRKRPVNQAKINRYITEHSKRHASKTDSDVEKSINSAATPAGISVYTPSDTGPRTPLAAPSPQENSNRYTVASPQNSFPAGVQNATPHQYINLNPQTPDPPSILSNPALFTTPSTPQPHTTYVPMGSPAPITPNQQPPSPATSISSIIRPTRSTFMGQSPAITPRTLSFVPRVSSPSPFIFQDQTRALLSSPSGSTVRTHTGPHVRPSEQRRYRQDEEEKLRGELSMLEIMLGESDSEYLDLSIQLADVLYDQGRYKSAEEIVRKSIVAYNDENQGDICKHGALGLLGKILYGQGRYAQAEKIHVKTTQVRKDLLGLEHPSTLISMSNLAATYASQERLEEAEKLYLQVITTRTRVLGDEHPDTLNSMSDLASTYWSQERFKEAEELELQVIEASTRVLGEEYLATLQSMSNLASTYWSQERLKEAEELELQVIEASTRVLGEQHPDTLNSMSNLASTYWSQERFKEAEELELQVIEARTRVLGEEHLDTLNSMSNLASTYWSQERFKEAEKLELQVIEARTRVLGEEHPDTLESMFNLASTYWSQERLKEAEELELQVIEVMMRVLGNEHPDALQSIFSLAATYWRQDRSEEAEKLEVQLIEVMTRVLGEEHPDTLESMKNLALTWKEYGRSAEAIKLMQKCVDKRTLILGSNHRDTLSSSAILLRWQLED